MTMRAEKLLVILQALSAFPQMFDYIHDKKDDVTIPSGKIVDIVRYENMAGMLLDATFSVTSQDIILRFTIDTNTFELTPRGIWQWGKGREERRLFRILRYDPDYNLFVWGFYPDPPYQITEKVLITMENATADDVVASWHVYMLMFTDELRNYLREIVESKAESEGEGEG